MINSIDYHVLNQEDARDIFESRAMAGSADPRLEDLEQCESCLEWVVLLGYLDATGLNYDCPLCGHHMG
jgi:hypothetical protein